MVLKFSNEKLHKVVIEASQYAVPLENMHELMELDERIKLSAAKFDFAEGSSRCAREAAHLEQVIS